MTDFYIGHYVIITLPLRPQQRQLGSENISMRRAKRIQQEFLLFLILFLLSLSLWYSYISNNLRKKQNNSTVCLGGLQKNISFGFQGEWQIRVLSVDSQQGEKNRNEKLAVIITYPKGGGGKKEREPTIVVVDGGAHFLSTCVFHGEEKTNVFCHEINYC